MFRLLRQSLLSPRAQSSLIRPVSVSRALLISRSIQVCGLQQQQQNSRRPGSGYSRQQNFAGKELEEQRRGRRRTSSNWGTCKESVMTVFEELLEQQATNGGEKLSQAIFEIMKSCANPFLLETPVSKAEMATKMVSMIKEKGLPLDTSVYNTLLRTYNLLLYPFTPSEILTDMHENKVEPNLATFSYLIDGYCQQGNVSGATKLLEHMNANDIAINEYIYASLITGHAQNGNMEQAEDVLEISRNKGYTPGTVAYLSLLCAYAKLGDLDGMLKVREQMRNDKVFISNTLLVKRVIDTLSLHGHSHLINDVLDFIKGKTWVLEDLRQLACTLFLRGEIESGFVIVRCLDSYDSIPTAIGQAAVHGMVTTQKPLGEILDTIDLFSKMTLSGIPVKKWMLYRDLLGLLFAHKLSTGDQRAEDILTVIRTMKDLSFVDNSYFYPVLAHRANNKDIEGCLDTLELIETTARNKHDLYSGVYIIRTLQNAEVSLTDFFTSNERSSIALKDVLFILSDTGRFDSLTQVLSTCTSSKDIAVEQILKRISLVFKHAYEPEFLDALVKVYTVLHNLEPQPSLEDNIRIIVNSFSTKKTQYDILYHKLLAPLIKLNIPIGSAMSDFLYILHQKRHLTGFKKIYKDVKDMDGVELSSAVHRIASMQENLSSVSQVLDPSQRLMLYNDSQSGEEGGLEGRPLSWEEEQNIIRFIEISDIETALKMREDMLQRGSTVRSEVYQKFIGYYARQGDVKNVLSEVEAMKSAGFTPVIGEYLEIMHAYAMQGEPEEVLKVIDEVIQKGWKQRSATTNPLVLAYLNKNSLSDVVRVVAEYRDHLAPSGFILKVVLNELVKQGRPQEELDVVLKALNERPTLSPVDVIDIEQKVYLNNQRMDKVREVMERDGYEIKQDFVKSMCKIWEKAGKTKLLAEFAALLKDTGAHRKNHENAIALLSIYNILDDGDGIKSLHQELIDNGCEISQSFTDLVKARDSETSLHYKNKAKP